MNGTHRADGILIGAGAGLGFPRPPLHEPLMGEKSRLPETPRLVDLAPSLLAAMGIGWDPSEGEADGISLPLGQHRYSAQEEAIVANRLRALGYLE